MRFGLWSTEWKKITFIGGMELYHYIAIAILH